MTRDYVRHALQHARVDLETAEGGIFYRVHGEGSLDWLTDRPWLAKKDRDAAESARKKIAQASKLLAEAARDLGDIDLYFN